MTARNKPRPFTLSREFLVRRAAPDLLKALELLEPWLDKGILPPKEAIDFAQNAIAKATGEPF